MAHHYLPASLLPAESSPVRDLPDSEPGYIWDYVDGRWRRRPITPELIAAIIAEDQGR